MVLLDKIVENDYFSFVAYNRYKNFTTRFFKINELCLIENSCKWGPGIKLKVKSVIHYKTRKTRIIINMDRS